MKRLITAISILSVLVLASSAMAQEPVYGFSISTSDTDPYMNAADAPFGFGNLFLWFACSDHVDGISAAEFSIEGTIPVFGFEAQNGWNNFGNNTMPQLGVGGCPTGPVVAATILVNDAVGGVIDLGPAASGGLFATSCDPVVAYLLFYVGFASDGSEPPSNAPNPGMLCETIVSVEDGSWGSIKGLYR